MWVRLGSSVGNAGRGIFCSSCRTWPVSPRRAQCTFARPAPGWCLRRQPPSTCCTWPCPVKTASVFFSPFARLSFADGVSMCSICSLGSWVLGVGHLAISSFLLEENMHVFEWMGSWDGWHESDRKQRGEIIRPNRKRQASLPHQSPCPLLPWRTRTTRKGILSAYMSSSLSLPYTPTAKQGGQTYVQLLVVARTALASRLELGAHVSDLLVDFGVLCAWHGCDFSMLASSAFHLL